MDTVERLSALGLRHVGYGVPVHLFEFFVEGTGHGLGLGFQGQPGPQPQS